LKRVLKSAIIKLLEGCMKEKPTKINDWESNL